MTKPLTVRKDEFVKTVVEGAQKSELPASILLPLLEQITEQVRKLSVEEAAKERKAWEEYCEDPQKEE